MSSQASQGRIRRMTSADLDRVVEIAASLAETPRWPVSAYMAAMDQQHAPPRIALVVEGVSVTESVEAHVSGAEQTQKRGSDFEETNEWDPAGAEAHADSAPAARLKPCPVTEPLRIQARAGFSTVREAFPIEGRERILGFAIAGLLGPEAELETIAIAPQHQRSGLGALLLRALTGELRKDQVTELVLEVRASNRTALGFYRAQGFEESGRRLRYYADPEEDAVLMRMKLV
ncbi:MAG: ribosomal protein S18-alanine N-acetyltransferase [Terracidiphilus sp.]